MTDTALFGEDRDARRFPRVSLPAMYTLARVRLEGEPGYHLHGHLYDLSLGGTRLELDRPLPIGEWLELRAMLPGAPHVTFRATGRVVRDHAPCFDEMGAPRMGLAFEAFHSEMERRRVRQYLADRGIEPEAVHPSSNSSMPAAATIRRSAA
jgi:c-di-GMP-binding flagellar brake protein YcgR